MEEGAAAAVVSKDPTSQGVEDSVPVALESEGAEVPDESPEKAVATSVASARVRRTPKQVTRLEVAGPVAKTDFKVPEGKGTKLRDLPNVVQRMGKHTGTSAVLGQLHTIMYGRRGKAKNAKANVLNFSGIVYAGGEDEGRLRVEAKCSKLSLADLKGMMDLMEIDRSSKTGGVSKDSLVERFVDWLECPAGSGKAPPPKRGAKKQKKRSAPAGGAKKAKVTTAKKQKSGGAVKKALSAFMLFSQDKRAEVVEQNEGISFGEVGKMLGQMWRSMSDTEKAPYVTLHSEQKAAYDQAIENGNAVATKSKASGGQKNKKRKKKTGKKSAGRAVKLFWASEFMLTPSMQPKKPKKRKRAASKSTARKKTKNNNKDAKEEDDDEDDEDEEDDDEEEEEEEEEENQDDDEEDELLGQIRTRIASIVKSAGENLTLGMVKEMLRKEFGADKIQPHSKTIKSMTINASNA